MVMHLLQRLGRNEHGSAIPLIAMTLFAVLGSAGVAVDSGRAYLVQSRLLTAVDAAGLAAGSTVSTQDVDAEVTKYLNANYPSGYVDSVITNIDATPSADNTIINITATATMPTVFMGMFGHDEMTVRVESQITRVQKGLEVVLALDTTGSMAGSKLEGAKQAAHDLLDILYGDRDTVDDLWVGLVPFAQAVNIGPSRTAWLDQAHYSSLNWHPTTWAGCVQAREADNKDTTDHTPEDQPYKAFYWGDHNSYNNWVTVTEVPVWEEVCTPRYCGKGKNKYQCGTDCEWEIVGYEQVTEYTVNSTKGPNKYCSQEVTPLTAYKSTVDDAIDTLTAEGNTHIVLGAVWAWHMLDPSWRGQWGGEMDANSLPLDYNTPLMNKAVILMTDGDNTITNSVKGAYGYLSEGKLGTTNQSTAESRLDTRLGTVCTNMKNNNIVVYTIAFGNGLSASTQTMLQNCASQPSYFFNSPTNEALQQAFKMIGDSLANLRVSK